MERNGPALEGRWPAITHQLFPFINRQHSSTFSFHSKVSWIALVVKEKIVDGRAGMKLIKYYNSTYPYSIRNICIIMNPMTATVKILFNLSLISIYKFYLLINNYSNNFTFCFSIDEVNLICFHSSRNCGL